jgi:hypothetical protein
MISRSRERETRPQDCADAREQLRIVERLGHVVVRAALEAADTVDVLGLGRQHDDRQIGIPGIVDAVARADGAADLVAAHVREHDVEQDHVGAGATEQLDGLGAGGGGQDGEVVVAQVLAQELDDSGLIVDDEHGGFSHRCGSFRGSGFSRSLRPPRRCALNVYDQIANVKVCNDNCCISVIRIISLR